MPIEAREDKVTRSAPSALSEVDINAARPLALVAERVEQVVCPPLAHLYLDRQRQDGRVGGQRVGVLRSLHIAAEHPEDVSHGLAALEAVGVLDAGALHTERHLDNLLAVSQYSVNLSHTYIAIECLFKLWSKDSHHTRAMLTSTALPIYFFCSACVPTRT